MKDTKSGLVVNRFKSAILSDCTFKVSEAGRQRVIATKHKNVHSGIVGEFCTENVGNTEGWKFVSYNPYKSAFFYDVETGEEVKSAKYVYLREDGKVQYKAL